MKNVLVLAGLLFLSLSMSAQQINEEGDVFTMEDVSIKVGDDLVIGQPAGEGDFAFIENDTKKKIGLAGKLSKAAGSLGTGVAMAGIGSGSIETISTGVKVANTAGAAESVANAGDILIKGDHPLTGQQLRVLKLEKKGNAKRGEHYFATVAGTGNQNFKIELVPAISAGEIAGKNNKLFESIE